MLSTSDLIESWAQSHGIEPSDGSVRNRVAVTFDRVRVHLIDLGGRGMIAEARLVLLPAAERERDRVIERSLSLAAGRLLQTPVRLCAQEQGDALCLQIDVPESSSIAEIDIAVGRLVDEVELLRGIL
jgi:hypothetical protein